MGTPSDAECALQLTNPNLQLEGTIDMCMPPVVEILK